VIRQSPDLKMFKISCLSKSEGRRNRASYTDIVFEGKLTCCLKQKSQEPFIHKSTEGPKNKLSIGYSLAHPYAWWSFDLNANYGPRP
jgi:hypothetical protein